VTVGIGLNPHGVALASIRHRSDAAPALLQCEFAPTEAALDHASIMEDMVKTARLRHYQTNLVLDGGDFQMMLLEMPEVSEEERNAALRWRIKDMVDFDIDSAVLDSFEIPGQRERGRQPMVYVAAANADGLGHYVQSVEKSELHLRSIDIPTLAQRNIAAQLNEDQQGVALLYLGADNGLLTLTRQGVLYLSRELEFGYRFLQQENSEPDGTGGLTLEDAPSERDRLIDNIVLEVQRSLDYYESHFAQPPIQSLIVAPLPQPISGLVNALAEQLGLQVRELNLNAAFDIDRELSREQQAHCFTAIGAALRNYAEKHE
jgi:MSHA biogenesis protein MshI